MTREQIKTKILMLKIMDYTVLIAAASVVIYSFVNSVNMKIIAVEALIGLVLVSRLGDISITKIKQLRIELQKLDRLEKRKR